MAKLTQGLLRPLISPLMLPIGAPEVPSLGPPAPMIVFTPAGVSEGASIGTTMGVLSVANGSGTYTFSETADPSNKFTLAGTNNANVNTSAAIDAEAAPYSLSVSATNGVDDPLTATISISVGNVLEVELGALTLSSDDWIIGTPSSGTINGESAGETISVSGTLPAGLDVDEVAGTWEWDGTGSVSSGSFNLIGTHPDGSNSPRVSTINWTIAEAPEGPQVILVLGMGQSNMRGNVEYDGLDSNITDVFQYPLYASDGDYHTISSDITPLKSSHPNSSAQQVTPLYNLMARIKTENPDAIVVGVLEAVGSTGLVGGGWEADGTGEWFERTVTDALAVIDELNDLYPGCQIEVIAGWVQGEADASVPVSRAAYLAALEELVSELPVRITGANVTHGKFVIGSIVPEVWEPGNLAYAAEAADINAAQADAARRSGGDIAYTPGPFDSTDILHYEPASVSRELGTLLGDALYATDTPSVTTAATQDGFNDSPLVVPLTHDGEPYRVSFEIHGGADAAEFELSDPYISPTLRWAGNDNGPANGDYVVNVRALDLASGNFGSDLTITVTQQDPIEVPPSEGWTFLNSVQAVNGAPTTGLTTASLDTSAADFIIATVFCYGVNSPTLSDSRGNTWTALTEYNATDANPSIQNYYCAGGDFGSVHTFTLSAGESYCSIIVSAFSGGAQTSPVDSAVSNTGAGGGGSLSTPSVTPSQNGTLLYAAIANGYGSFEASPGSGFTLIDSEPSGASYSRAVAYMVQETAAAQDSSWTWTGNSGNAVASLTAFKPEP